MSSFDGPCSLTLQVILTLLMVELGGHCRVSSGVGFTATGGSLIGAFYMEGNKRRRLAHACR